VSIGQMQAATMIAANARHGVFSTSQSDADM
jgi:hypothetical protein